MNVQILSMTDQGLACILRCFNSTGSELMPLRFGISSAARARPLPEKAALCKRARPEGAPVPCELGSVKQDAAAPKIGVPFNRATFKCGRDARAEILLRCEFFLMIALNNLRRAAYLSFVEMRQKSVQLGSNRVAVTYPHTLDHWFDDLVLPVDEAVVATKWVRLSLNGKRPGRFDVFSSVNAPARGLDLGDALATFWERVSFLLIDELRDALVLHAAALCRDNGFVLLPGRSGAGKTRLSLWYRAQSFELGTDEIFCTSVGPNGTGGQSSSDPNALLRANEVPLAQQEVIIWFNTQAQE